MVTVRTLPSPARRRRGVSFSSRLAETSKAYTVPVLAINAPRCSVLPPAPAQKSTIISLRFGSSRYDSNWLPSSCTSNNPSLKLWVLNSAALGAPQADGRVRRGFDGNAFLDQAHLHLGAFGLECVDAQVQRCRLIERLHERERLGLGKLRQQFSRQPIRQVRAHGERDRRLIETAHPFGQVARIPTVT